MEKKIDYERLNENLDKLIFDSYAIFEEDLLLEERFCDIILNDKYINAKEEFDNTYVTRKKISLNKTINISLEFLENLNLKYALMLNKMLKNGVVTFVEDNEIEESYLDNAKDEIKVKLSYNVQDVLNLVHETIHYTNCRSEIKTETTMYYTESISNWIELLLVEYLKINYPKYKKDAFKMRRAIFKALYEDNICTKIILELMKKKINGKYINTYEITDILNKLIYYCSDFSLIVTAFDEVITKVLVDAEEAYLSYIRNTVGLILGCYMCEIPSKKEIITLNDNLFQFDLINVLYYLNLDFVNESEFNLIEESYKKLEKSYKNNLKKLW